MRLIVVARAAGIVIDLLQADQVRILVLDDFDDPFQPVPPIASADAFVDVVTQEPHEVILADRRQSVLKFACYNYQFEYGHCDHNGNHGGAILSDSLRWRLAESELAMAKPVTIDIAGICRLAFSWRHALIAKEDSTMITATFADRETERKALAFLLGRFSGRALKTGEHLLPDAALQALADQSIPFTVKGRATYEQQLAAVRGSAPAPVQ